MESRAVVIGHPEASSATRAPVVSMPMMGTLDEPVKIRSAPDEIHRRILHLITERQLVPGSQLPPERDLARTLEVSRTTVRDALRSLADQGLLRARQGSGWFLEVRTSAVIEDMALHFKLSDMTLAQIMEARSTVEPTVASLAAIRRTADQLGTLKAIVAEMAATRSGAHYALLTDDFHALLVDCAHNPFFNLSLTPVYQLMKESREPVKRNWSWRESLTEHQAIAAAIEEGDDARASGLAQSHVNCVQVRNLNYRDFTARRAKT
jgi:GntR family transcriptional repressor for pyruvate dehydrogenase complex